MSGKRYLKHMLPVLLIHLTGMSALILFLTAVGNPFSVGLFVSGVWIAVLIVYSAVCYLARKKRLDRLLDMTEQLEERYLLPEVMDVPKRAEEEVYWRLLKMAGKSMLEKTGEVRREQNEYREYIEQWIHEVKTPVTAMKLLCENNALPCSRELSSQLEQISRLTEQVLYYARSNHAEKDYFIREIRLSDVVHAAIADNRSLLRQNNVSIEAELPDHTVYTDDKWVRFILNQLIGNSIKYHARQPALRFFTVEENGQVLLSVEDNGIGIPQSDLPRIFEKGFTGRNGRTVPSATGIGLYLCRRLCEKLGIGLSAYSNGTGTTMTLSFHINDFITGVQG